MARQEATETLRVHTPRTRLLSLDAAVVLQAVSHLFRTETERESVYGSELTEMTGFPSGVVSPILDRLEDPSGLFVSTREQINPVGIPRRLFRPTPLGETILAIFQAPQ